MTPHYADDWLTVYAGDCRAVLATLPAESVHCVVTSPPYWGLRDYGTATWDGGDADHAHVGMVTRSGEPGSPKQASKRGSTNVYSGDCACGATRIDNQLGLEPTPDAYVENMVAVFREVKRVLRNDGTLWLNLGDSYNSGPAGNTKPSSTGKVNYYRGAGVDGKTQQRVESLKPKDLVGIPWRVAFALQADGWYLRSDIIWSKPNPMPESVTDRPTKSHEYLFLFAKSPRYYFDGEAVRLPISPYNEGKVSVAPHGAHVLENGHRQQETRQYDTIKGANIRSVWTVATQPYPGAHFATFPPKLVEPCIKAGTSERGVCPECGAPWRRVVERGGPTKPNEHNRRVPDGQQEHKGLRMARMGSQWTHDTTGWQPSCEHDAAPIPATLLDPFAGSGTVGTVAQSLSRRAVLIDLNPDYIEQQLKRNAQTPLGLTA
jgi:DNA modification methylase